VAPFHERFRGRTPGGTSVWLDVHSVPLTDASGRATAFLGTVANITHEHHLREELAASASRFRGMADGATDVIYRLRLDELAFEYVNPAVEGPTGLAPAVYRDDPLGTIRRVIHHDDLGLVERQLRREPGAPHLEHVQLRWVHVDGTVTWAEHHFAVERDDAGGIVAVDAIARDITASKRTEQELRDLAHQDPLTGLPNRRAALELLELRIETLDPVVALFVDLDGFKDVNDRWGHDVGDQLLVAVGQCLASCVRVGDLVARLAGDEFLVVTSPDAATPLAQRIIDELRRPFPLSDGVARVSASIGVAAARDDDDPEALLRRADLAMYEAKRAGGARAAAAPLVPPLRRAIG
jgi:diguanylate cyclase (GGDEF)-like protein/PAS domain S-box-containing protein